MALSEYEKVQFEKLTANFAVDGCVAAVSTKESKDKAKPSWSLILLLLGCIAIALAVVARMNDNLLLVALGGVSGLGLVMASIVRSEEETYMERVKREQA